MDGLFGLLSFILGIAVVIGFFAIVVRIGKVVDQLSATYQCLEEIRRYAQTLSANVAREIERGR